MMDQPGNLRDQRLLIIDDERPFGDLVARVARSAGYLATVTDRVDEFLRLVDETQPSLLSIDLLMPGVDGIELLRDLAARGCRAHILVISGSDGVILETAEMFGRDLGLKIFGALSKPLRAAELRQVFDALKTPLQAATRRNHG
jgi:DNA-binding response OmpR family regulator